MSSVIKTHKHDNYDILKEFSESSASVLLYKGKPIIATSTHETELINTEKGVHGLRFYNSKLQYYYNGKWNDIATGGGGTTIVTDKDIDISPAANNALVKYSNGYYVQAFMISNQINNALVKYSDGYYVPKIPANNATTDDINKMKDQIDDEIEKQNQVFNERYDVITTKILEISGNTTKSQVHEYKGNNPLGVEEVIDISTLYSLSKNVILNLEFMIVNTSAVDSLNLQIIENELLTLNDTLTKSEIQRYKLPNIPNLKILVKGAYNLFLYVTYV